MLEIFALTLLVFSRRFGMKVVWKALLAAEVAGKVKSAMEEGVELFAYSLVLLCAIGAALNNPSRCVAGELVARK